MTVDRSGRPSGRPVFAITRSASAFSAALAASFSAEMGPTTATMVARSRGPIRRCRPARFIVMYDKS